MKRESTVCFVLVVLFLVSVFPMSISFEAADSRAQVGSGSRGVETASFLPSVLPSDISLPDPPPPANLDEQLGLSFTQNFTGLAYNVTAIEQADVNGYGPAYLLNGLSSSGYWYQVGLSWNWPYLGGGYDQGFHLDYEVFDPSGSSIFPGSGGGLLSFSGTVNQRDTVLLTLNFSGGNVIMSGYDFNTSASAQRSYSSQGAASFTGTPYATTSSNGFFTGLMTEWYHVSEYLGNEAPVLYSQSTFALSSAWMWMDEFNTTDKSQVLFSDATSSPVSFTNPTQFQSFFSHGAAEYSSAYQFITGGNPETVYVMSDGSVAPSSAPISSSDNVTYAFTGNISYPTYFGIVVERSNIVINGNGYAVQGNQSGNGVSLVSINNVTVENTDVEGFQNGFYLNFSSGGVISENNASTNSQCGIWLVGSSNCNITANNMANNYYGLELVSASNNAVYHNNFVGNSVQASVDPSSLGNAWNDTYPSGGNYWSDYKGPDLQRGPYQNETGGDGVGDIPNTIDARDIDHYPLMKPYPWGSNDIGVTSVAPSKTVVGQGFTVSISVTVLNYGTDPERFNVTAYANATSISTLENLLVEGRNSTTIAFTWSTTGFAYGNYTINAYAWPVPGETNTADNSVIDGTVYVGIPGDLNGDGTVNASDAVLLVSAFKSRPGDANWSPNADINGDNVVDVLDAVLLADHFRQHYP
jgi:parallel beta-helix repeat protein